MNYTCRQTLAQILTSQALLMNIQYVFCLHTARKNEAERQTDLSQQAETALLE